LRLNGKSKAKAKAKAKARGLLVGCWAVGAEVRRVGGMKGKAASSPPAADRPPHSKKAEAKAIGGWRGGRMEEAKGVERVAERRGGKR